MFDKAANLFKNHENDGEELTKLPVYQYDLYAATSSKS
jgi:hypothetical protein